jgi:putative ATP-binding cassette transporter
MDTQRIPLKVTAARFVAAVKNFVSSEVGWKAKLMFFGLIALLCGANGLNVVNSYVGRDFMSAIAERHQTRFVQLAVLYMFRPSL